MDDPDTYRAHLMPANAKSFFVALSALLAAALVLGAWVIAILVSDTVHPHVLDLGRGATATSVLALAWVATALRQILRGAVAPRAAALATSLLLAAAATLGLEAGAAALHVGVADARLIALLVSALMAVAASALAMRPWLFTSFAVLAAGPLMVASSSVENPDPGLVASLGVIVTVMLTAQWALAAGLRRSLDSGSEQGARLRRLEELNRALSADRVALQAESRTDPLTGLANRRYLEEVLHSEWNRCRRSGGALSCLLIDIDYFKPYNDHYGHDGGDACLEQVASVLQNSSRRASDLVSRIGGEEFVVLLPETGTDGATTVADMLKRAVSTAAIPHVQSPLGGRVTVSVGVATLVPGHDGSPGELLKAADLALYDAKRGGRNRIVMASPAAFDLARLSVRGLTTSDGRDAVVDIS